MTETEKTPKWARRPENGCTCRICGQPIYAGDEYEVVKPKAPRPTMYFHSACVEKEKEERRAQHGGH